MNHDNLQQAYDANQQATAVVQRQAADRKQFLAVISEGRPWNEHVVAQEASQFLVATTQSYLEVCKRVAWAKLMSPSTAQWLALSQRRARVIAAQSLCLASMAIATATLLAYVYHASSLLYLADFVPMAFATAAAVGRS